jgi:hypothetical protein
MSFKRSSVSQSARPDATSKQVTGIENGSVYLGVGGWLAKSNDWQAGWLAHIAEAEDLLLGLAHSPMPVNLRVHDTNYQHKLSYPKANRHTRTYHSLAGLWWAGGAGGCKGSSLSTAPYCPS